MARNFAINVIRMLFMGIDWVIYNLSSWLMQVIFDLANLPGATFRDTIGDFSKKIYLIFYQCVNKFINILIIQII